MQKSVRNPLTALIVIALAVQGLARGTAAELFTPQHVAKLRSVSSVALSPDGRFIAYVLRVPRIPGEEPSGSAWTELHVVYPNGIARPFVTGDVHVGGVAWTHSQEGISFLSKRGGDEHRALYVIPIDGGEATRVLEFKSDISEYSWSPDGSRVAFVASDPPSEDERKLEEAGFNPKIYEEDYRRRSLYIAVPGKSDAEPRRLELEGSPSRIVWAPQGSRIALTIAPTPLIDDDYMERRLHVVNADSGKIVARFENPGKLGSFVWSPDARHLAVISAEDIHDPSAGRLLVAPSSGGALKQLRPDFEGDFDSIAWKDPETILYVASVGVWNELGEIRLDGSSHRVHVAPGSVLLSGLSLSRDGRTLATISESPRHPGEVHVFSEGNALPRRLTDSNPWLREMRFAEQEVVSFKARDGLELEGLLIRPLDEKEGDRYPLILTVHGGPEAHYRNGWLTSYSRPGQTAAARGFAVLYPNYRGSTGRGVEFSKMGQADYAGREFDDTVDAVDHLIAAGLVDRDRVGITGGSYGGYASAWGATYHSKRFAASVMFVGISDLISKYGTTDIPREMALVHARRDLYESWQWFLERSPIYHVEQARTPLLILHGEDDPRVHPGQSLELYRHLKTLGRTPVRLVLYPGEGHGNRRSAARLDYNLRMLRWFEHYLQGPGGEPPAYRLDYGLDDEGS